MRGATLVQGIYYQQAAAAINYKLSKYISSQCQSSSLHVGHPGLKAKTGWPEESRRFYF